MAAWLVSKLASIEDPIERGSSDVSLRCTMIFRFVFSLYNILFHPPFPFCILVSFSGLHGALWKPALVYTPGVLRRDTRKEGKIHVISLSFPCARISRYGEGVRP
jgi:hypothetical protein